MDTKQAGWIPNWGQFGILGCHLATLNGTTLVSNSALSEQCTPRTPRAIRSFPRDTHSGIRTASRLAVADKGLLRYGSVRSYGTVRFWQKVRYGITYGFFRISTVRKYGIIFSVSYTFRTPVMHALHFCFQVLHFTFLPITLPRQLRSPLIKQFQITITFCEKAKLFCYNYNLIVQS